MTSQQVNHLCEQVASLTQELSVARQQLQQVGPYLICQKRSDDRPLQNHGMSKVCGECYEALRVEFVQVALVLGSMRTLVLERMHRGHPCPFCGQVRRHTTSCYLDTDAGGQLLDEYRAIEQHRDLLLADREKRNGYHSDLTPHPGHGLKDRARLNGHAHLPPTG